MYSTISLHHGFRNSQQLLAFWGGWKSCHASNESWESSRDSNRDTFGAWSSSLCWRWQMMPCCHFWFKVILAWNCNLLNVSKNVDMMLYSCHGALKWKLPSGESPFTWNYIIHIYCMFLLSWYSVLSFELDFANLPILQLVFASINYKGIYHYLSLAWCTSHDFTIIWSNLIFSYMFISHLVSSVRSLRCAMCPYPWSPATPGCQSHQPHQRSATARFGSCNVSFHSFGSTAKRPQTATKCS